MKHFAIAEITITDPGWVPGYIERTTPMVESRGGRYLTRTSDIKHIEGDRESPQVYLLIEWPSKDAAMGFYESEEYRPLLESRKAGSTGDFWLVSAEDITGRARIE